VDSTNNTLIKVKTLFPLVVLRFVI